MRYNLTGALTLLLLGRAALAQDFMDCHTEDSEGALTINNRPAKIANDGYAFITRQSYQAFGRTFYKTPTPTHEPNINVEVVRDGYIRFHNFGNEKMVNKVFTLVTESPEKKKYVYLFGHDSCRLEWPGMDRLATLEMYTLL